jgi:NAD(P)-dependent dehydrogenase (short-subunit alcohol dehydrogenase family)
VVREKKSKTILITGGTSGLGKQLTLIFLGMGYEVFVTGCVSKWDDQEGLRFFQCDFTDFNSVVHCASQISSLTSSIDVVINNAGILSPPGFIETTNGFEKSYQVNFLAHFLLTSLLRKHNLLSAAKVVNVSSPMYRRGSMDIVDSTNSNQYSTIKAYANSKLFLALFSAKLAKEGVKSFTFNPGTFSSGIYRSQDRWFRNLYHVAAPFMTSAHTVATKLEEIISKGAVEHGEIVNRRGKSVLINSMDENKIRSFWTDVEKQIAAFL